MCVDYIRTAYVRGVRFFKNRPDIVIPVRWYRCKPDAKNFPGYTRFASGDWAYEKASWTGTGEVLESKRVYDKGVTPATAFGQNFCGSLQEFAEGLTWPPPGPPVEYDVNGIPTCCQGAGPPPPPEDDVRDINFWKQVATSGLNRWYTGGSLLGATILGLSSAVVDHAWCAPFFPSRGGSLNRLGVWIVNPGDPGTLVNCALYDSVSETDLSPGDLVVETGDMDAAAASAGAWLSAPIAVTLDKQRLYWLAVNCNQNSGLFVIGAVDSVHNVALWGVSDSIFQAHNGIMKPLSYGPFPTTFPPINDTELSQASLPGVGVQYDG